MYYLIGLHNSHTYQVIAEKGTKHMSAGSGTLVTIYCAINALWNTIPPMFIFKWLFSDMNL